MQLVNLQTPHSIISNELITTIQSGDLSKSKEIVSSIKDHNKVLRSYYLLACRQSGINNEYLSSAMVFTDAISELIKRLFPEDPQLILEAALDYYCSINYTKEQINFPKPGAEELNSPVVVKELSETIEKGDLENAYKISKKLLTVMDSKAYYFELLLEEAAKSYTEKGESIIIVNSIRKAVELFKYKMNDEFIWYVLNLLVSKEFKSIKKVLSQSPEEIMYSEYVLRAASQPGNHGRNLLFMGHARQIYKAASVKYREIWGYLSSFIQAKLAETSITELEEIEPVRGDIVDFEKSLNIKDIRLTMTFVNEILKSEVNVSELFGTMALSLAENGKFKFPGLIIYLNMARRLATALDYPRNLLVYNSFLDYLYSDNYAN